MDGRAERDGIRCSVCRKMCRKILCCTELNEYLGIYRYYVIERDPPFEKHDGNRKKESIFSNEKLREYNYSIIGIVWLSNCIKTRLR